MGKMCVHACACHVHVCVYACMWGTWACVHTCVFKTEQSALRKGLVMEHLGSNSSLSGFVLVKVVPVSEPPFPHL